MNRFLLSTLTLSLMTAFAGAADLAKPAAPISGIDTQFIDPSVRAQDDFFSYLNGKWLKTTEIPADKSSWGTFAKLRDDVTPQLRGLIENAAADKHKKAGTDAQRIGDLYASFMDEKQRTAMGYKPLAAELQRVHQLKDKKGVPALIAHMQQIGVGMPYSVGVSQDAKESTKYAAHISQGGLGLPDPDYYLKKDDAKMAAVLVKYQEHIAKVLGMAGEKDAPAAAAAIVAFETQLAKVQWTKVQNRDSVKRYNKIEIAKLGELTPGYDWMTALSQAGIANKVSYVIVSQPSYLTGFNAALADTELGTLKSYFTWHLLRSYSEYLSPAFADANFAFYGATLTGVKENRPQWKIGVSTVDSVLGEVVGRLYVAQYFPAERKARMEELIKNMLAAYKQSIDTLDWMSPETKLEAQAKLAKFQPKIAYPDHWRDYSALTIKPGDLVGNITRARQFA